MAIVTVIMPAYNGMPYLHDAVTSILNQTVDDFKFIIINDNSTDDSGAYLESINDPRVDILHLKNNSGTGGARNIGLERCSTELVALIDADDIAYPRRLEAQIDFLREHPRVGLVGCQVEYLSSSGKTGFSPPLACDHETIYHNLLRGRHAINTPSIMCRTDFVKQVGGYRILGLGEDWDMLLRICEVTRVANLESIQQSYRLHPGSSNAQHYQRMRDRYAHACHCARLRKSGKKEISFDVFLKIQKEKPMLYQMFKRMDNYGYSQYRTALEEILGSRPVIGWGRLAWSSLCSPMRSMQYFLRLLSSATKPKRD